MGYEFSRIMRQIRLTSLHHSMLTRVTPSVSIRLNRTGKKRSTTAILVCRWHEGWATVNSPAPPAPSVAPVGRRDIPHRRRACQVAFHLFHQLCRDHLGTDALFTDDKKRSVIFSLSTSSETVLPGPGRAAGYEYSVHARKNYPPV